MNKNYCKYILNYQLYSSFLRLKIKGLKEDGGFYIEHYYYYLFKVFLLSSYIITTS